MCTVENELYASIKYLIDTYPPGHVDRVDGGIYNGVCGIALLLYTLDRNKVKLPHACAGFDFRCLFSQYYDMVQRKRFVDPRGASCGAACDYLAQNYLCYLAHGVGIKDSRISDIDACIEDISKWALEIAADPRASNEWLYGRAGFLYYLRAIRNHELSTDANEVRLESLYKAESALINAILKTEQPWIWHDTEYIGAAHGAVGIITQVVLSDSTKARQLEPVLRKILASQHDNGNWPNATTSADERLVQFCHGAAGAITSLQSLAPYYAYDASLQREIQHAVKRGAYIVQERTASCRKESCLCHGCAGNAISLASLDLQAALALASTATEERLQAHQSTMLASTARASLFSGVAGRIWAWLVLLDCKTFSGFLGYNDQ